MMSVNPWMKTNPETIKAAIMASATFNADTTRAIEGTKASDKEGAGVVDAGFCYQVAYNGRSAEHTISSSSNNFTENVYVDYTNKSFRAAVAWNVTHANPNAQDSVTTNPDIDVRVKKNGMTVASSSAYSKVMSQSAVDTYVGPCTNYEIIELTSDILSQYGAGYYELYAYRTGSSVNNVKVGVSWEQW